MAFVFDILPFAESNSERRVHQKNLRQKLPEKKAVDHILKGVKVNLPKGSKLRDRFGKIRTRGRLRWWEDLEGKPFSKVLFSPMYGKGINEMPDPEEISRVEPYPEHDKPVFVGHYCLEPHVSKINENIACLDGCVTCDQKLWGYRHNEIQQAHQSELGLRRVLIQFLDGSEGSRSMTSQVEFHRFHCSTLVTSGCRDRFSQE